MSTKLFLLRDKIGKHRLDLSLLNLNTELNVYGYTMGEIAEFISFHKKVSLAVINDKIVGWSIILSLKNPWVKAWWANNIADSMGQISTYVSPEHRQKGIGKQLVIQELKHNKDIFNGVYFFAGTKNRGKVYKKAIKQLGMTKHHRSFWFKGWFYSFYSPKNEINAICKIHNKLGKGKINNVYF